MNINEIKMNAPGIKSFEEIIKLVKESNFFKEKEGISIKDTILSEINLDNVDLPFRLKCFTHKQEIKLLEELLNIKHNQIIKCRNIGIGTIAESRKIIIEHLNNIKDCFRNLESEDKNIIVTYFPLLKGVFRNTRINFNIIYQDLSCINVPKRIEEYIKKRKELKSIYNLLNINYDELKKEQNIGNKTIGKLQNTLISLLNLEKVIFLPKQKKYELVIIPKAN